MIKRFVSCSFLLAISLCGAAPLAAHPVDSYAVMAPDGAVKLRSLVRAEGCPVADVDGRSVPMATRSAPRRFAPRANAAGEDGAVAFALRVCETSLRRGVRRVRVDGQNVPVAPGVIRRIVVIGDTGCRLKSASHEFQACHDGAAWPFARIARAAAARRPDLVLHVGDYLYRENPCPPGNNGCQGAAWGYGWDGWKADFFRPARPLLAAAPWVMVRGNHEECRRAGQGWRLLLDPHALDAGGDCADPAQDALGDHSPPYAVDLGAGARLIVADFAAIGEKPLKEPALSVYRGDARAITALARPGQINFVTTHYPFGALVKSAKEGLRIGYDSVGDAFAEGRRVPALPHVSAMIAGHVHMLQYGRQEGYAVQIVNGFSGTQEAKPKAPAHLAELAGDVDGPAPDGLRVVDLESRFGRFGYGLLERGAHGRWRYTAYGIDGRVMLRREIAPRR